MQIVLDIVMLLVGFVLLIKGADVFVDGAVGISRKLKIPTIVVGLTIVAFGTSAPEASVSISAALAESNGIAVGNVLGSNLFNLLVVTGISAMFMSLPVSKDILKRDYPFMMFITVVMLAMLLFVSPNEISRSDGIILLVLLAFFLFYTVFFALRSRSSAEGQYEYDGEKTKLWVSLIYLAIGLAAIVLGGDLVVDNASAVAVAWGMDEILVGLTIVALGTSLPELVTSIVASRKGENDIAIGNVVGSNIFNILMVLGISSTINPISVGSEVIIDTVILIAVSLLVAVPIYKNKQLGRASGVLMVLIYAVYLAYIIMRNYGVV